MFLSYIVVEHLQTYFCKHHNGRLRMPEVEFRRLVQGINLTNNYHPISEGKMSLFFTIVHNTVK